MTPVKITSIYGKTLNFTNYTSVLGGQRNGSINVQCCDDDGVCKLSMVFSEEQVNLLREALGLVAEKPAVTVSTVGELSSIEVTGGNVVINATGTVIVNNK